MGPYETEREWERERERERERESTTCVCVCWGGGGGTCYLDDPNLIILFRAINVVAGCSDTASGGEMLR